MHKVAGEISSSVTIPLLHIADATSEKVKASGARRVGLLATAFTMEQNFYKWKLTDEHGLEVLVPEEEDRRLVHGVIYEELCLGIVEESSRQEYRRIVSSLVERDAEAVILGCTEITMLVDAHDAPVPLFDTTRIHAEKAVEVALGAATVDASATPASRSPELSLRQERQEA